MPVVSFSPQRKTEMIWAVVRIDWNRDLDRSHHERSEIALL